MKFDHTTLLTRDFDRLIEFYRSLPGATVATPSGAGYTEVKFQDSVFGIFDVTKLGAYVPGLETKTPAGSVVIQFSVSDVDETAEKLRGAGVTILADPQDLPWGCRSVYATDPDGNLLEFYRW